MNLYITIGLWVLILFFLSSAILSLRVLNAYNKSIEAWLRGNTLSGRHWQAEGERRERIAGLHPLNRWMGVGGK